MTPDHITILTALIDLVQMFRAWPLIVALLVIIIGPWVLAVALAVAQTRRFESVVRMYERNVELVKSYDGLSHDLKDIIMLNTQAVTKACKDIETNQFCPAVRLEKKAKGMMDP